MKINLDILCDSFAKQMIHIKCQDLFSLKNKKKKKKNRMSSATNFAWHLKGKIMNDQFYCHRKFK